MRLSNPTPPAGSRRLAGAGYLVLGLSLVVPLVVAAPAEAVPTLGPVVAAARFPDASTTGVPRGVSLQPSGSITVKQDGAVVSGLDIHGTVVVEADNVTIRNSRIRSTSTIPIRNRGTNLVVEDTEIDGQGRLGPAVAFSKYTLRRVNIHNIGEGPRIAGGMVVIEDSFIHHLVQVGDNHTDAIQSVKAPEGLIIRRNNIQAWNPDHPGKPLYGNAAFQFGEDSGPLRNCLVEGNYMNGGNYTVNGGGSGTTGAACTFRNNRFGQNHRYGIKGNLGPNVVWDSSNKYDDGAALAPSVPDNEPSRAVADMSVTPGSVRCVQVAGRHGVPEDATGVVMNVTTVRPNGPGYVVVYPDTRNNGATPMPAGSTVNFEVGADVANSTFVGLGANGKVCYATKGASRVGVLMDVATWTTKDMGVVTQAPRRVLDTRPRSQEGSIRGPVRARHQYTVDVARAAGLPANAAAVLLNVTVTGALAPGNLRVFPAGAAIPSTSVVNYAPGQDKANGTVVALADGKISFWSDTPVGADRSPVHVVLDVVGYTTTGSAITGVGPQRVVDTRPGPEKVGSVTGPVGARAVHSVTIGGVAGTPETATAVVLNVTAIGPDTHGNLRVYPDTDGNRRTLPPTSSSLNYIRGRDTANMVVVRLPENGRVNFWSDQPAGGKVHLAVDVVGYLVDAE